MSGRADILAALRANRPQIEAPLPRRYAREGDGAVDLVECFAEGLQRMGGELLGGMGPTTEIIARVASENAVICSTVSEFTGNFDTAAVRTPAMLHSVDLAIVRAAIGVAETGSVLLTDHELEVNALAYLAQHLLVLLDRADIVPSLDDAYDHPAFRDRAYACFHTGPSATADIEGVLIRGAQGVKSLRVLLAPRAADRRQS